MPLWHVDYCELKTIKPQKNLEEILLGKEEIFCFIKCHVIGQPERRLEGEKDHLKLDWMACVEFSGQWSGLCSLWVRDPRCNFRVLLT